MSPIRTHALALAAALTLVAGCATSGAQAPAAPAKPAATRPEAKAAAPAPKPAPAKAEAAPAKAEAAEAAAARPAPKTPPQDEAPWASSPVKDWSTPPKPGPAPSFTPPTPETFTLQNGVKVVLVERHALPLVSMTLIVDGAGSAADPKGEAGLAAYTADLLDEGADGFSALSLAKILERQGASLHTGVARDYGYVNMTTLSKTLQLSMDLFGKVVTEPSFHLRDTQRIHKQRMVALKQRGDHASAVASMVLAQALYGRTSPYGHAVDGYPKTLAKIGSAQAVRFYRLHWRPKAMTLVVVGDVSRAVLEHDLHITIGSWHFRGRGVPPVHVAGAPAKAPRFILVDRPGAPQSALRIGMASIKRTNPRFFDYFVANAVLGNGFTSRLNHELREVLGYTYGAGSYNAWLRGKSQFVIYSAVFTPHTVDAVRHVIAMVKELAKTPVPAAELKKAKDSLIRDLPSHFEGLDRTANVFGSLVALGLPLDYYQGYDAKIRAVTAAGVQQAAATLLPEDQLTFVVVGDARKIEPGLEKLLGPPVVLGPDGLPVKAPKAPKAPGVTSKTPAK